MENNKGDTFDIKTNKTKLNKNRDKSYNEGTTNRSKRTIFRIVRAIDEKVAAGIPIKESEAEYIMKIWIESRKMDLAEQKEDKKNNKDEKPEDALGVDTIEKAKQAMKALQEKQKSNEAEEPKP